MLENGKRFSRAHSKCFVNIAQGWGGANCVKCFGNYDEACGFLMSVKSVKILKTQLNLPSVTTGDVKPRWSVTGGGRLQEFRIYWIRILPH